ncbi:MAG TPA: aminoacyl-tRNA hydrolase [bacterium]|nr:aminoacyl-tRNA hydrolase [bacterium]
MWLIVGLGNPGTQYTKTRHNAGFMAVDFLLEKEMEWKKSTKGGLLYARTEISGQEVKIIKPQTYMNNSGEAVLALIKKYNIAPENLIVIYDELDLPFGTVRAKLGGSSAGHNGIKSILEKVGIDNFWRVRIGISNKKRELIPADKFVLSKFSKEELELLQEKILPKVKEEVIKIIK